MSILCFIYRILRGIEAIMQDFDPKKSLQIGLAKVFMHNGNDDDDNNVDDNKVIQNIKRRRKNAQ